MSSIPSYSEWEEAEWSIFEKDILPILNEGVRIHLNSVTSPRIWDRVREIYKKEGYYSSVLHSYVPDLQKTCITLGVDLVQLVYHVDSSSYPRTPSAVRASIAALNDGIITRIFAHPQDSRILTEYFSQSHINLCKLANGFLQGWKRTGLTDFTEFALQAVPPFWPEALSE